MVLDGYDLGVLLYVVGMVNSVGVLVVCVRVLCSWCAWYVVLSEMCVEVAMVRSYGYMHWYICTWW